MEYSPVTHNPIVMSTKWINPACLHDNGIEPEELHPRVNHNIGDQNPDVAFCNGVFEQINAQVEFANIFGNFALRLMKIHYTHEQMLRFDFDYESFDEFQRDFFERVDAFYYWLVQDPDYAMLADMEYLELSHDDTGIPSSIKFLVAHNKLLWSKIIEIHKDFSAICNDIKLPASSTTSQKLHEISQRISVLKEKYVVLR